MLRPSKGTSHTEVEVVMLCITEDHHDADEVSKGYGTQGSAAS